MTTATDTVETATTETTTNPFKVNQIILWHWYRWHNIRQLRVPGIVVALDDKKQIANIQVRNLRGETKRINVPYSQIEVRG